MTTETYRETTEDEMKAMYDLQTHLLDIFKLTGRHVNKLTAVVTMDQINLTVEEFIRGEDLQAKNYTFSTKEYSFREVVGG